MILTARTRERMFLVALSVTLILYKHYLDRRLEERGSQPEALPGINPDARTNTSSTSSAESSVFSSVPTSLAPLGEPGAQVKLRFFASFDNPCEAFSFALFKSLALTIPEHIHVEFMDSVNETVRKEMASLGIDECETYLLINGEYKKDIFFQGKERQVRFRGPVGLDYPPEFIQAAIEQEFEKQYGPEIAAELRNKTQQFWREGVTELMEKYAVHDDPALREIKPNSS